MARVTVVGSCNIDLVTRTARFPHAGEHLIASDFGTYLGGKGANQAVAARRAGATVRMVARVGRDAFAEHITSALASDGIDVGGIGRDHDSPTGNASIWLDASGENQILVFPGANATLGKSEAMQSLGDLDVGDVVLMQLEVPMATVLHVARLARAHGASVVLNAAPAAPLPDELRHLVDVLVVNETEAATLAGGSAPAEALRTLASQGFGAVVITLGRDGCLVTKSGDVASDLVPPFMANGVVDATGAGDAFCGAFAARLAAGDSIREAAVWGSAAGSLAVEVVGAIPSMPTKAAIEDRLTRVARD